MASGFDLLHKFGVNETGSILTEVSIGKINQSFKPIIKKVLDSILQSFSVKLDGVYLYGSVATGKAILGSSDIDFILLFKDKPSEDLSQKVSDLGKKLSKIHESTCREVALGISYLEELHSEKEQFGLLCFMKHLCICLHGNDVTRFIPEFKPSPEVARGFNGDIEKSLKNYREQIKKSTSEADFKKISQALAKKIIRTGFSLVMPRLESWTTDLQTAHDAFIEFYPQKRKEMGIALAWSKSGSSDAQAMIAFIDAFGLWLTKEFQHAGLAEA